MNEDEEYLPAQQYQRDDIERWATEAFRLRAINDITRLWIFGLTRRDDLTVDQALTVLDELMVVTVAAMRRMASS